MAFVTFDKFIIFFMVVCANWISVYVLVELIRYIRAFDSEENLF